VNSPAIADIELTGVGKTFESEGRAVVAIERIDLAVARGELVSILGPSGCGKTTALRMIAGLVEPSKGEVSIFGTPLWNGRRRNDAALARLGVVFQEPRLFPWFTIEDNVALPLRLRGQDEVARRRRAGELCELVGIGGFTKHRPNELSGGMRQRAAIARALAGDPRILLMDEPFGALDAITRDQMNLELQRIWLATGCTILLVTHSISEAVFLADRVVTLSLRPSRIHKIRRIDFAHPRDPDLPTDPEFQTIVREIKHELAALGR
jgi:NitT/TauT family transport system ATP-binding protein